MLKEKHLPLKRMKVLIFPRNEQMIRESERYKSKTLKKNVPSKEMLSKVSVIM